MSYKTSHPEQDPAEGSRDIIERELARQTERSDSRQLTDDKQVTRRSTRDAQAHRAQQQHRL